MGRVGLIDTTLGFNFEFTVITAVVLGGTSLFGGKASIVGSVIGAILLSAIDNGLNIVGANPFIYEVVRGLVLMTAISWTRTRLEKEKTRSRLIFPDLYFCGGRPQETALHL